MMIKDFCVRCQYRYLRMKFHSGLIEHPALVRQPESTQAENLAIRPALHVGTPAADRR
jgi:hypothetical protein